MNKYCMMVVSCLIVSFLLIPACVQAPEPAPAKVSPVQPIPVKPADFYSENLKITPPVASIGEPVRVSAQINNRGGKGDYKAVLMLDNEVIDSKVVTVGELKSSEVIFSPSFTKTGKYVLRIGEAKDFFIVSDCSKKNTYTI